jgi:hypothetical protein
MTVLRREDVQSNVASWDGRPYRMIRSPILTIVPLIVRRLRGPSPDRLTLSCLSAIRVSHHYFAGLGVGWSAAHKKPASSRAMATAILGAGL